MPWIKKVRRNSEHQCRKPPILWRRIGSIWQCPSCGGRWVIDHASYSMQHLADKEWERIA